MSQYYVPRPSAPRTSSSQVSAPRQSERDPFQDDLESSIYVFPNPSSSAGSAPSSPSLGSDISVPTELTLSNLSDLRSRHGSRHGSVSRERSGASVPMDIGRHFSVGAEGDPEVEIWDWNADTESIAVSDESVVGLEGQIDRAHRWELLTLRRGRQDQISTSSLWRARQQQLESVMSRHASSPPRMHQRELSHDSDPGPIIRHPHTRIPMLSFLASLLFVDDSTVRLLTHPSSESALFPGHTSSVDEDHSPSEQERALHSPVKLMDNNQTLKGGLAVACDPDFLPFNPFALTSLPINSLLGIVNGVWNSSGRAWREVWR